MDVRGEEVRYWFEQAVSVPAGSRNTFLQSSCPDEDVRSEVLSLLKYDAGHTASPEMPVSAGVKQAIKRAIGSVLDEGKAKLPVQRVGRFELGRLLGSGGMGSVYEAHRVDGEVRQRVAVKFVQVSPTGSEEARESVHRRFYRERQMLASLRHPYIAGLIDAGTTEDGTPYAVIEQVDGVPIDTYCDTSRPDQVDRIRLVLKLCDAVQFAHRNLIVHSDIKPENVLVTADGIPKLIDFGVASDLGDNGNCTAMRAFTPGYASPEQLRGLPATVATDVYGLGAVLYRLLTAAPVREVNGGSLGELIRHIEEEDVVRPSAIRPELKGDLENILLKALQRDPHRRYGSVPELADDLNRFLARRPVRASPDSTLYRTRRFVQRHWVPIAATVVLVVSLAGTTIASLRQRENALRRALETRRLAGKLLFEVHDEIGGMLGGTKAREKLSALAVQYLEELARDHGNDPELLWELLNAYSRLGQSRGGSASSIGDSRSGSQLAMKALELGAIVESTAADSNRLDSLFSVYASLSPIFFDAGHPEQQRETIDRMLRLADRLEPVRQAQALKELARHLHKYGSPQESAEALERALTVLRTLSASPSKPAETDTQLVSTLADFGRAQSLAGNFSSAVATLNEAIRLAENRTKSDPHIAKSARQLYWSHIAIGDTFGSPARFNLGRPKDAVEHYQKARKIAEKLVSADPANEMAKLDLARTFSREGMALAASEPANSLALLDHSHSLVLQTSSQNHFGLETRLLYLTSSVEPLVQLGYLERARSHVSEARAVLNQMQQAGIKIDQRNILEAEAIRLHASGDTRAALAEAQKHLGLLSEKTHAVLSANFETVKLLERIRTYAASLDDGAHASATKRLVRIWEDLRAIYPQSEFVVRQVERLHQMKGPLGHVTLAKPSGILQPPTQRGRPPSRSNSAFHVDGGC
jgi:eukaryotic-like serine/threonine-protein kinase